MPVSIHKKLYSKKENANPVIAGTLLIAGLLIIFLVPPFSVLIEFMAVTLMTSAIFFGVKSTSLASKWSWILPAAVFGFILMGRIGILDYVLGGLWIAVIILISLFN